MWLVITDYTKGVANLIPKSMPTGIRQYDYPELLLYDFLLPLYILDFDISIYLPLFETFGKRRDLVLNQGWLCNSLYPSSKLFLAQSVTPDSCA